MMNNKERLANSAAKKSLYNFFKDNTFLVKDTVKLKPNYSKGTESPWSLSFDGHCLKDIFGIDNPVFCSKFAEAISGDGQEANKIMTLHSSSLLSLLVFYSVSKKHPIYIDINGNPEMFTESKFEVKNEVYKGSNNYSNIDVVLYGENYILFLESKFSEYLGSGPVEVKKPKPFDYYEPIYSRLTDVLSKIGLVLQEREGKRVLERKDNKSFYCEGLKQMISHYLGVTTEIKKGFLGDDKRRIALGEILFNFNPSVSKSEDKLETYKEAYSALREGLIRCAQEDDVELIINDVTTYQSVLGKKKNHSFVENMPKSIRELYKFEILL